MLTSAFQESVIHSPELPGVLVQARAGLLLVERLHLACQHLLLSGVE